MHTVLINGQEEKFLTKLEIPTNPLTEYFGFAGRTDYHSILICDTDMGYVRFEDGNLLWGYIDQVVPKACTKRALNNASEQTELKRFLTCTQ